MKEISIDTVALEAISSKNELGLVDVRFINDLHAEGCKLRDKISELYTLIGKKEILLSEKNEELSACYSEISDKEALIVLASKKMLIAKSLVDFELQSELEECFAFAEEMFKDGNINDL